jgi:hypothetical protein
MAKATKYKEADLPAPGSVFIVPLNDGRFGAVRVLSRKVESGIAIAFVSPTTWIGNKPHRPADKMLREPLILNHHAWNNQYAGIWVFEPMPPSLIPAGNLDIQDTDYRMITGFYSGWDVVDQILLQWRWDHDRENLLREEAIKAEQDAELKRLEDLRRQDLSQNITLPDLAMRSWFDEWSEEYDGVYIELSRKIIQSLIESISNLPKVGKSEMKRLLKSSVREFNQLDKVSHFIETEQRESIYEALELITFAVKMPDLIDEIDTWRKW